MPGKKKKSNGVVSQAYELASVDSIHPHPRNVNEGDLGAILESVDRNGFIGAVIVQRSTGNIVAGKHRWLAAKQQGIVEIPVIFADVDDATALRYMLADNRTSRLGADNPQQLAELLESIRSNEGNLTGTGFSDEDLQELLEDLGSGFLQDSGDGGEKESDTASQARSEFKIVIDCDGENHQAELLDRFKAEGFDCHALTN